MEKNNVPYERIFFVCTNRREGEAVCCSRGGSEPIREALKRYVRENKLIGKVRISQSGCMDLCAQGPNIMVFPDNIWYKNVRLEDLPILIQRYLDPLKEQPSSV